MLEAPLTEYKAEIIILEIIKTWKDIIISFAKLASELKILGCEEKLKVLRLTGFFKILKINYLIDLINSTFHKKMFSYT